MDDTIEAEKLLKRMHKELTPSKETDELLKGMSEEINASMELDGLLTRMRKELNAAEQAAKNKAMLEQEESWKRMLEKSNALMMAPFEITFKKPTILIEDLVSRNELLKRPFEGAATSTTTTLTSYNDTTTTAADTEATTSSSAPSIQPPEAGSSTTPESASILDILLKPKGAAATTDAQSADDAAADNTETNNIGTDMERFYAQGAIPKRRTKIPQANVKAKNETDKQLVEWKSSICKDTETPTTSKDIQVKLSSIGNVEAAASGTTARPWYLKDSGASKKLITPDDLHRSIQEVTASSDNGQQFNAGESSSDEQKVLYVLDQGQMGVDISKINSVQKSVVQGVFRLCEIYKKVEERKKEDIVTYSKIVIDPAIMDAEKHPGTLRTLLNTNLLAVKYVGHVTTDLALKYSPTEFSTAVIAGSELIGHGVTNVCNLLQQVWEACAPNIAQESARALGNKMGELHQILQENTTSGEQFAMYLGAGLLGDKAFTKLFSVRGNKVQLTSDNYAKIAAAPVIKEGALGGFVYRDSSSGKVIALFDSVQLTPKVELPKFAGLYGKEAVQAQLQHAQMIKRHVETMIEHGAMSVEASTALEQEIVLGKLVQQYQRQYGKYQQLTSLEEALAYELKMVGKGQVTGTPGHAEMSSYIAQQYAQDPNVAFVFLDQGMKKITGLPIKPNRRPDVVVVYKNGKIDLFEVRSMTDADAILKDRMAEVIGAIPEPMRGKQDVIKIPGINYKD